VNGKLLVVAGEYSGDRAAAAVLRQLPMLEAFGLGGAALEAAGMDLVADLRDSTAMGLTELWGRTLSIGTAFARVLFATHTRKPRAALLVNYTEFNARLASRLRAKGVRVLWYGAPQVWAWRRSRAGALRRHVDRMAVTLPFEEALWREHGVDAHYVGHPALEDERLDRGHARERLGLTPLAAAVAILPGSRPHEVQRLLPLLLQGYESVRIERACVDARVLLAPSLDRKTRAWALQASRTFHVEVSDVAPTEGAGVLLQAFDAALCASGTVSLEAACAGAVPVVAYRVGALTELAARTLLTTDRVALPNVLLGRTAFAELLQREARPARVAEELARALDARETLLLACAEVRAKLGELRTPSIQVARMLAPWLAPSTNATRAGTA
jgi:lipid-A-disaccharide synthase